MGTNQSLSSLFRGIGPLVTGIVFSFSVSIKFPFLAFWMFGFIYMGCGFFGYSLSAEERWRVAEQRNAGETYIEMEEVQQVERGDEKLVDGEEDVKNGGTRDDDAEDADGEQETEKVA